MPEPRWTPGSWSLSPSAPGAANWASHPGPSQHAASFLLLYGEIICAERSCNQMLPSDLIYYLSASARDRAPKLPTHLKNTLSEKALCLRMGPG